MFLSNHSFNPVKTKVNPDYPVCPIKKLRIYKKTSLNGIASLFSRVKKNFKIISHRVVRGRDPTAERWSPQFIACKTVQFARSDVFDFKRVAA
jgi:hypothetical protein